MEEVLIENTLNEKTVKETVVLKNKKLKIVKVEITEPSGSAEDESGDKTGSLKTVKKQITKQLRIEKGEGNVEVLKENTQGEIVGSSDRFKPGTTLNNYADEVKRNFYRHLLNQKYSEIENLVILSGAGTSVGIGKTLKGQTMKGLWDKLSKSVDKEALNILITAVGGYKEEDLEELLSLAAMRNSIEPKKDIGDAILSVKNFIVDECTLDLDDLAPHGAFLNKIALRPQKFPRVKIFTLNYDTLFEQAALKERFTVIDGFTFSNPRVFNGKYFDYDIIETRHNRQDKKDSTIAKLFYLFKMHGSLNWKRSFREIEQCDGKIKTEERVMIFPQSNKYEHSYEQPYFEMMARFQQALRTENTLLITIGFSFYDKHISSVILESLKQNPSLNLMSLTFEEVVGQQAEYQKELHRISDFQSRVTLIAESFADFSAEFPENVAHRRLDVLESLNEHLKNLSKSNDTV